jgi:hypothetical protein
LMQPPGWNERELHQELEGLTRIALRNWLKAQPDPLRRADKEEVTLRTRLGRLLAKLRRKN